MNPFFFSVENNENMRKWKVAKNGENENWACGSKCIYLIILHIDILNENYKGGFDTDADNDGTPDAGWLGNFLGNLSLLSIAKIAVSFVATPIVSFAISAGDTLLNYASGNINEGQFWLGMLTSAISYGVGEAGSALTKTGDKFIETGTAAANKAVTSMGAMYYAASAGVQGVGNLLTSGLRVNKDGRLDWYMDSAQFAGWGLSTVASMGLAYANAGYNPNTASTWDAAKMAMMNWGINSTVSFLNKGWKTDASGRLYWQLDEGRGEVTEAFMDFGIGTMKSALSFAFEGHYTGYGTKANESILAFALGKGMDIYKYNLYQQGVFGSVLQEKYRGQNAFDLAGGIDLTILQRDWKDNGISRSGAASLRILSTGLELHSGAGEFGGFGFSIDNDGALSWNMKKTWANTMDNFRDIGQGIGSVLNYVGAGVAYLAQTVGNLFTQPAQPYGSETPAEQAKAMADNMNAIENEQRKKLDEMKDKLSKLGKDKLKVLGLDKLDGESFDKMINLIYQTGGDKAVEDFMMKLGNAMNIVNNSYVVKEGDELWKIAKELGISTKDLLELNPQLRERKNTLHPGEIINLSKDNVEEFAKIPVSEADKRLSQRIEENYIAQQQQKKKDNTISEWDKIIILNLGYGPINPNSEYAKQALQNYADNINSLLSSYSQNGSVASYDLVSMQTTMKNFYWGDYFSTLDEFYSAKQEEMGRLLQGTGVGILAGYGMIAGGAGLYYGGAYLLEHVSAEAVLSGLKMVGTEILKNGWKTATINTIVGTQLKIMDNIQQGKDWYEGVPETAASRAMVGLLGGGYGGYIGANKTILGAVGLNAFLAGAQYASDTLIFGLDEFTWEDFRDRSIFGGLVSAPAAYFTEQMMGLYLPGTLKRDIVETTLKTWRAYFNREAYKIYKQYYNQYIKP